MPTFSKNGKRLGRPPRNGGSGGSAKSNSSKPSKQTAPMQIRRPRGRATPTARERQAALALKKQKSEAVAPARTASRTVESTVQKAATTVRPATPATQQSVAPAPPSTQSASAPASKRGAALAKARAVRLARIAARKAAAAAEGDASTSASPVAAAASPTFGPDPFYLTTDGSWRIVALDARQWQLQRRQGGDAAADDGDDSATVTDATDAPTSPGYVGRGYYSTIAAACHGWAQKCARERSGPLPAVLATVIADLDRVLAQLALATREL